MSDAPGAAPAPRETRSQKLLKQIAPERSQRAALAFAAFYVVGVAALLAVVVTRTDSGDSATFFSRERTWVWLGVLVPSALVLQQGLYVAIFRPPPFAKENRPRENTIPGHERVGETQANNAAAQVNLRPVDQFFPKEALLIDESIGATFGAGALIVDYFLPTLLNVVCGGILAYLVCQPPGCCGTLPEGIAEGVRFGGLGAFIYVLMMLSERSFQRDVTRGAAIWSAAQMLLGPLLGGISAVIISDQAQFSNLTRQAIYFFAGLAPRPIVSFVQETVGRFFGGERDLPARKLIPLSSIRGITPRIEDRLLEVGITDGYLLAMANPIQLARDTPFDERQILAWIDESFLLAVMGERASVVQREGITGAIDLAYYHIMRPETRDAQIKALAERIQMDEQSLSDTVQRLYEDDQVRTIWMLYQGPHF